MNTKGFLLFCLLLVILNPIQCIKAEFNTFVEGEGLCVCSFNITSLPVYGHFQVTGNAGLDLYIMNESESQKWFADETEVDVFYREVSNTNFSFTFSSTGLWYVVLDNTKSRNSGYLIITFSNVTAVNFNNDLVIFDQRFYQPPGLPEWVLLVAGLAVFVSFFWSIVYVKFLTKRKVRVVKNKILSN